MKPFTVYLLHCADDSYYVGHTDDLAVRLRQHQDGVEGYTATRRPLVLAWTGEFETREGALGFERQIKGWSRAKKEALMRGDWEGIQALARNGEERGLRQAQPERPVEVRPERLGVSPESPTTVRPEPVEGLLRLRGQMPTSDTRLRQAQPEREGVSPPPSVLPELAEGPVTEGLAKPRLRQAQPEREGVRLPPSVLPELVEGPVAESPAEHRLRQAQPEREGLSLPPSVLPEPVEGPVTEAPAEPRLRQAQPEREGVSPPPSVLPEPVEGPVAESPAEPRLRQAQPERGEGSPAEAPVDPLLLAVLSPEPAPRRRAIAKTITLLESTRADHRQRADALLNALLPHTGKSFRLGISGVPGVGKSTFIEALGLHLIAQGHRVAVLAVDPSSSVSGGSILGDKTRMEQLSVNDAAYIRPSPSSGTLGGVAERTREAMLVCEAAGYDIVIVETVGVGQSETAVAGMTDMFVLMQLPNAGDDLQAIKKGVMEIADLVVINKADLDEAAATRARAQISSAQRLFHGHGMAHPAPGAPEQWHPTVIQLSALKALGVDSFWQTVQRFQALRTAAGQIAARRQRQDEAWMWERLDAGLKARFRAHPGVREQLAPLTAAVRAGELAASVAARRLLDLLDQR